MSKLAGEGCKIIMPTEERKPLREIEKSIIKKYRKYTWSKFINQFIVLLIKTVPQK